MVPKQPPNHLGRRKAQDALDRWVYGCKAALEVERGNDVIGVVHKQTIALFAKSEACHRCFELNRPLGNTRFQLALEDLQLPLSAVVINVGFDLRA